MKYGRPESLIQKLSNLPENQSTNLIYIHLKYVSISVSAPFLSTQLLPLQLFQVFLLLL